jgi:hypothetical protein
MSRRSPRRGLVDHIAGIGVTKLYVDPAGARFPTIHGVAELNEPQAHTPQTVFPRAVHLLSSFD